MGNMTGIYSGNSQSVFSPKGLVQAAALPEKLKPYHFDHVLVSPAWRTQRTILPYLATNNLQAEIWPEIEEVDCGLTGDETPAASFPDGDLIEREDTNAFQFRDGAATRHAHSRNREQTMAQLLRAVELIQKRFGGTGNSILLVSHGCSGGRIAELLLGLKARGRFSPANTALFHIRQDGDGHATLLTLNDAAPNFFDQFILTDGPGPTIPGFVNLAGAWKIRAGDEDRGDWLETRVPGGWENDALPDYDGIAWYRHEFVIDETTQTIWSNRDVVLVMGAIDDADETFLNGTKIGASGIFPPNEKTAFNKPRQYIFPAALIAPTNVLSIRVSDWMGGGGLWRAPVLLGPADGL
jgi:broad specificity phosphatase PhoE